MLGGRPLLLDHVRKPFDGGPEFYSPVGDGASYATQEYLVRLAYDYPDQLALKTDGFPIALPATDVESRLSYSVGSTAGRLHTRGARYSEVSVEVTKGIPRDLYRALDALKRVRYPDFGSSEEWLDTLAVFSTDLTAGRYSVTGRVPDGRTLFYFLLVTDGPLLAAPMFVGSTEPDLVKRYNAYATSHYKVLEVAHDLGFSHVNFYDNYAYKKSLNFPEVFMASIRPRDQQC
jgi:hypothetical protein